MFLSARNIEKNKAAGFGVAGRRMARTATVSPLTSADLAAATTVMSAALVGTDQRILAPVSSAIAAVVVCAAANPSRKSASL